MGSARECSAFLDALVEAERETVGGEVEAWGKSKLPVVKASGKGAGGGDGEEGGLGIGDVGARSH